VGTKLAESSLCSNVFRYKIIKDKNGRTGHGRSSWVYFDVMDEMMRGDPAITPPVTISSLGGVTGINEQTAS